MKKMNGNTVIIMICVTLICLSTRTQGVSPNEIDSERKYSRLTGPISKPPSDSRDYRGIILANEMKVILISDPSATEVAASLSIAAGSMNNPEELPGLAHFAEHMLFLGSEKYPEENGFQKFLSEHGGTSNAATHTDETYYYFKVSSAFLRQALDRLAHLVISPLFTESGLEREVNAVHSEHQKNIPEGRRRLERILSCTTKDGHPYTHFRTGSRETLWTIPRENGTDIRKSLLKFHESFYSSNLMSLVVFGKESLDELQEIVEDIFMEISNNNVTMPVWSSPYGSDELQERIEIVPISTARSVLIIFPIPYFAEYYRTTAGGYLAHLLGQEGVGSFASLLKNKHWANFVAAGPDSPARGFTNLNIKIKLTEEGFQNLDDVILHLFEAIKMIRESGPQKWFWEEVRDLNKMHFRFSDEQYPLDLVKHISTQMARYPIESVFHAGGTAISTEFNPHEIQQMMELLTPENCRIIVTSKNFENTTQFVEKYYGIKYNRRKLDPELIKKWNNCGSNKDLHLPVPNEYIPTEFSLKQRDEHLGLIPRVLSNTEFSQIWYLQDNEFLLPKAFVRLEIMSPAAYMNPLSTNLNWIFANLVLESLSEFQYNGNLAGLDSDIINSATGFQINVKGYDHKLGAFLQKILEKIVNFDVNEQRFKRFKESRLRVLNNRKDEQPREQVNDYLNIILWQQRYTINELISVMNEATVESLNMFVNQFLSRIKFKWQFYGNLTPKEALVIAEAGQNLFVQRGSKPLFSSQMLGLRYVELPQGASFLFQAKHESHSVSCVAVLFQIGLDDPKENVLGQLLEHIAYQPSFDQLRTKEQLGYTAWAHIYSDRPNGPYYFRVIVQGDHHPKYVESRIDSFINDLQIIFKNMTSEDFERHKGSLMTKKSNKPTSMENRAGIVSNEIIYEAYNFDRQNVELEQLQLINLDDMNSFFDKKIMSQSRSRIVIHIFGAGQRDTHYPPFNVTQSEEILEPAQWKKKFGLFQSIKPFNNSIHLF